MPDNRNQGSYVNQYRRKTLFSGTALLAICFSAPASLASGDGGGDGGEKSEQTNKSNKKSSVRMSQTEFRSLSKNEAHRLSDRVFTREINFQLDGFSTNMSSRMVYMLSQQHSSTRRLLKDMSKLKTKKARQKRLDKEIERMTKLEKLLKESQKRLKAKTGKHAKRAAGEEWARWVSVKSYIKRLKTWRRFPNEGMR